MRLNGFGKVFQERLGWIRLDQVMINFEGGNELPDYINAGFLATCVMVRYPVQISYHAVSEFKGRNLKACYFH